MGDGATRQWHGVGSGSPGPWGGPLNAPGRQMRVTTGAGTMEGLALWLGSHPVTGPELVGVGILNPKQSAGN